jgi:hypothetical protein
MNTNTRNSRILNSILPVKETSTPGIYASFPTIDTPTITYIFWGVFILIVAGIIYYFKDDIQRGWDELTKSMNTVIQPPPEEESAPRDESDREDELGSVLEKVLPEGQQVFNVSSNKYTYYDAEPLCKALGAELATYDQVKEAWSKGADWCNYGWVKGQMAVYPTSQETYNKAQAGSEGDRNQCGQVGLNGGYFDNPELRYGVTCYGKKPANNLQNSADITRNTPTSPEALAYDKKVAEFKQQASTIAILPNNSHSWN